ncbi:hypothetical protein BS47DRAFT_1358659 [Hydnum rufescens UP504]|uniref:Uncharacterized protein n=1 Tax=Hydnum rufescens UP504 TaxID=1448309 RepID=A0A9P6E129_9AGAM|nr:hypothetical protein BS47DRAFT_1358659 [Hydnum rufescens UP504]
MVGLIKMMEVVGSKVLMDNANLTSSRSERWEIPHSKPVLTLIVEISGLLPRFCQPTYLRCTKALSEKGLKGLGPFACPCQYLGSPCDAELLPVAQQQHDPLGSLLQGYLAHLQLLLGITERNLLNLHREGWYIMGEVPEEESKEAESGGGRDIMKE